MKDGRKANKNIRRQLTLFVQENDAANIELVRCRFNPEQSKLINSHVTLCREDEIENLEQILYNLTQTRQKPISITFGQAARFNNGKGVFLPGVGDNNDFHQLRINILKGINDNPRRQVPHITLMHSRNSTCTDYLFEQISKIKLPHKLTFNKISIIEQEGNGSWKIIEQFKLTN